MAEYVANNPDASDADIAANAGPRGGYSGGFRFDQATVNADLNGVVNGRSDLCMCRWGLSTAKKTIKLSRAKKHPMRAALLIQTLLTRR